MNLTLLQSTSTFPGPDPFRIGLAGNPNCGKTSRFNALTGTRHRHLPVLLSVLLSATLVPGTARAGEPPPTAGIPAFPGGYGPETPPVSPASSAADPETAPAGPAGREAEPGPGGLAKALAEIREALGLSGFLEVRAADTGTDPNVFSMGDFGLEFVHAIGRNVQVAALLTVNEDGASLPIGYIDIHLVGAPIAPRGRLPVEKGVRVQLGRFDLPFGGDWPYFDAKDRTELSAPLTTSAVLDGGYNDVGLRVLGGTGSFGWSAFWIRGEGDGTAVGGRIAFTPLDNLYRIRHRVRPLEIGVSALHDFDGDGGSETISYAIDAELRGTIGLLRAEYARRDERAVEGGAARFVRSGFHVTASVNAGAPAGVPLTPYARWDVATGERQAEPVADEPRRTERVSAGLNALFFDRLAVKLEYQRTLSAPAEVEAGEDFRRDALLAQAVVTF